MDFISFQAAVTSLKAAADISKSLLEMKTSTEIQAKVTAIQSALLDAQTSALGAIAAQYELQERVRRLETELKQRDDWRVEKRRYTLVNPWRGPAQVYAVKRETADGEPPHLLCPNCFHAERRVVLTPQTDKTGFIVMVCPTCKATINTGFRGIGAAKYAEDYSSESA